MSKNMVRQLDLKDIGTRLERELRRLAGSMPQDRAVQPEDLLPALVKSRILPQTTADAAKDLLSICRRNDLGAIPTVAQRAYVIDVGPDLVGLLEDADPQPPNEFSSELVASQRH